MTTRKPSSLAARAAQLRADRRRADRLPSILIACQLVGLVYLAAILIIGA